MNNRQVYIIVLNYNGWQDTVECVHSLLDINYPTYKIVIVDNASTDDSVEHLMELTSETVTLIETDHNYGYAGGNNFGIRYAIENEADYICTINNDTLVEKNFLGPCVDILENEEYAISAPVILEFGTNIIQSAGGSINVCRGLHIPFYRGTNYKELQRKKTSIESQFISGCCMVFRADLIKHIGYLPEAYFLFYEETEWCYRAIKKGYKNVCVTESHIEHKDSGSVSALTGVKEYLLKRNRAAFVRRNGTNLERLRFAAYITLYTVMRAGTYSNFVYDLKCYRDGMLKKTDPRFPYIVINESV